MSSDLETSITQEISMTHNKMGSTKKKKPKPKLTPLVAADPAKNEGDDPHWAYEPPKGVALFDHTADVDAFDWDAINDDQDTEIWLVRVPDSIKTKHLQGLEIDPPSSSRTARVGSLTKKQTTYDVWSIGDDHDHDDIQVVGGDELRGLSCLLPRKSKSGRLYVAPKSTSRHIVISARPPTATPAEHQPVVHQNPPRPSYPKDLLKHAFVPYGARSEQTRSEVNPSVDMDISETAGVEMPDADIDIIPLPTDGPTKTKTKESKGKKRKAEGNPPKVKKSKKHKADA